jgi:ABC-type sugar transport system ATPase subunit
LGGEALRFSNPREAREAGIAMFFQELNLVSNLTVAENIFMGRETMYRIGFIDT